MCSLLIRWIQRLDLRYGEKRFNWVLGGSTLSRLSSMLLIEPRTRVICQSWHVWLIPNPQKSISSSKTNFQLWHKDKEKTNVEWMRLLTGFIVQQRAGLNLVFTALWFDSQLAVRTINILYGASAAVSLSCTAALTESRWRGWMLLIVRELFNMLDAGDLLFNSLTPVWCGGLTASYTAFTAHTPAVFSRHL